MSRIGVIALFFACIIHGVLFIVDKAAVAAGVPPFSYSLVRIGVAALMVGAVSKGQGKDLRPLFQRSTIRDLIFIGVLAAGIGILFYVIGLETTSALNASLINSFMPVFTAIFAALILSEKLGRAFFASLFLMLAGVELVQFHGTFQTLGKGDLLIVASAAAMAMSTVWVKKTVRNISISVVTLGRLFYGFLSLLVAVPLFRPSFSEVFENVWLVVLGGGLFALRTMLYHFGIEKEGASRAAAFLLFGPVVTALLLSGALGEPIAIHQWLGISLVVAGGYLLVGGSKRGVSLAASSK